MSTVEKNRSGLYDSQAANESAPLIQLQPFNEHRFDDCMAYLAKKHSHALSLYEMMKLHVMIDVYHFFERGKPVIGGSLWPYTNGPVSRSAKSRITGWKKQYENSGDMPEGFLVIEDQNSLRFKPTRVPEDDDFSKPELSAMTRAWEDVVGILQKDGWEASQNYFHSDSFIGRAWNKARKRGNHLDWKEIIAEYQKDSPDSCQSDLIQTYVA